MSLKVISIDGVEPVSIEECRNQCYIIGSDTVRDSLLMRFARSARQFAENYTWLAIVPQTVEQSFREFDTTLRLQRLPISEIVSLKYWNGSEYVTLSESEYYADLEMGYIESVSTFPHVKERLGAVQVRYKSGVQATDLLKFDDLRTAILMHVKYFYDNRDAVMVSHGSLSVIEPPMATKAILDMHSKRVFV